MKFKWSMTLEEKIHREIGGNTVMPWYWGIGYKEWNKAVYHVYVFPLFFFVRWGLDLWYVWHKLRAKPTWADRIILEKQAECIRRVEELNAKNYTLEQSLKVTQVALGMMSKTWVNVSGQDPQFVAAVYIERAKELCRIG